MKFDWDFHQGFTAQAMSGIDRSNWGSIWYIPDFSGVATGNAYMLGCSTQICPKIKTRLHIFPKIPINLSQENPSDNHQFPISI